MKAAVSKEHRFFFRQQGAIELEELLTPSRTASAESFIYEALASRLSVGPDQLKGFSSDELFMAGRDLWRTNPDLKKVVCFPN